jgi:hypothetical protein
LEWQSGTRQFQCFLELVEWMLSKRIIAKKPSRGSPSMSSNDVRLKWIDSCHADKTQFRGGRTNDRNGLRRTGSSI